MITTFLVVWTVLTTEPVSLAVSGEVIQILKDLTTMKEQAQARDEGLSNSLKQIDERLKKIEERLGMSRGVNPQEVDRIIKGMGSNTSLKSGAPNN